MCRATGALASPSRRIREMHAGFNKSAVSPLARVDGEQSLGRLADFTSKWIALPWHVRRDLTASASESPHDFDGLAITHQSIDEADADSIRHPAAPSTQAPTHHCGGKRIQLFTSLYR